MLFNWERNMKIKKNKSLEYSHYYEKLTVDKFFNFLFEEIKNMRIKEKISSKLILGGLIQKKDYPPNMEITDNDIAQFVNNISINENLSFTYNNEQYPLWYADGNGDNFSLKSSDYLYVLVGKDELLRIDNNKVILNLKMLNETMMFYHLIKV